MTSAFRGVSAMLTAVLAVVLVISAEPATAQQTVLKMQASWPASLTLYDNFQMFADRVNKISGGTLKIEAMPAGQVVPAFEVLDATHKKVIDGAHAWAGYWVGKNKASILLTGGPGGLGMDYIDYVGWMYDGGGWELYQDFYRDVPKLNVVAFPILPSGPQALRLCKGMFEFMVLQCIAIGLLIIFPKIAIYLPEQLNEASRSIQIEQIKDDTPSLEVDTMEKMQEQSDREGAAAQGKEPGAAK